jgi:hypothetical protein
MSPAISEVNYLSQPPGISEVNYASQMPPAICEVKRRHRCHHIYISEVKDPSQRPPAISGGPVSNTETASYLCGQIFTTGAITYLMVKHLSYMTPQIMSSVKHSSERAPAIYLSRGSRIRYS